MMRVAFIVVSLLAVCPAAAERGESSIGLAGGLRFPSFGSQDPTDFILTTWSAGAFAEHGVLDDLFVGARFHYNQFDAVDIDHTATLDGRQYAGGLTFELQTWHVEVHCRYKVYAGHDLVPHLTLAGGWIWTVYRAPVLTTPEGQAIELTLDDFAEGAFTTSGGVVVDYRLLDMLFVGFGIELTHFWGDVLYGGHISVPVSVAWYW